MMFFKNSVVGNFLMVIAFACWINAKISKAFGTFGFDIHHRYSDTVKQSLNGDGLPEEGTIDYYNALAHRDQVIMGRRLAATSTPILTFYSVDGNETYSVTAIANLHFAYVRVGTPYLEFLVALDTGSDLFWLPCDCTTCARYYNESDGSKFPLDIYSPSNSTTSSLLPCNSPMCGPTRGCLPKSNTCSYQEMYGTSSSSTGILVDDVLHLGTNTNPQDPIDVTVTLGCGKNQTGGFLERGGGINGIFGLGMDDISVPSVLAKKGFTANSFSLCFVNKGLGRIEFGDKGSAEQKTTPFNLQKIKSTYNVAVTHVTVGNNVTDLQFTAILDSTFTYSYFTEPAYSFIVNNFISRVTEKPYTYPYEVDLKYCFALSENQTSYITPNLTFTMKGGNQYNVTEPTLKFAQEESGSAYCLAIMKSKSNNIIGHNFMTGHRLVFDREEMIFGWKESDCYDSISSDTQPPPRGNSTRPRAPQQQSPPPPSGVARLSSVTSGLVAVMLAVFFHNFIVLSS
ncbi:hypothetical protein ABFX02_14G188600 [Erythranthe guttata]